jgi:hypothetical protein
MALEGCLREPLNNEILSEHLGYALDLMAMALRETGETSA